VRSYQTCRVLAFVMLCVAGGGTHAETQNLLQRGGYLVRVTGCVGCHSPRSAKDEVVEERRLTGGDRALPSGDLGRLYPPNITPEDETGIGTWSTDDIVKALKSGEIPGGRILSPAMPWRTQYKDLTDADALAIATYLKSLAPVRHQVPGPLPPAK
jgi:mono/diheme cytochrome c family protein